MRIKNKAIRKLEAKRLYLNNYAINDIADRIGSNIIEIDKWRIENAWDDEKRLFIENQKRQRVKTITQIDKLLTSTITPEILSTVILIASSLPASDVYDISKKIFKQIKGVGNE